MRPRVNARPREAARKTSTPSPRGPLPGDVSAAEVCKSEAEHVLNPRDKTEGSSGDCLTL